jgi:hypothetical protein
LSKIVVLSAASDVTAIEQTHLERVRNMSWELGFAVMGALGVGIGVLASWVQYQSVRFILLAAMPFAVAWALYWLPTSADGSPSEYANWAPIFIYPWAFVAYIAAATGFLFHRVISKPKVDKRSSSEN